MILDILVIFCLMNIYNLSDSGLKSLWFCTFFFLQLNLVPRKAEQDPKPVQEIHNEATIEDQEEPRSVQQPLLSEGTKIQPGQACSLNPL